MGMFGVSHPRLNPTCHLFVRDPAAGQAVAQPPQPIAEPPHVRFRQTTPPAGQQHKSQKLRRRRCFHDPGFARMQTQAAAFQKPGNPVPPDIEATGVVMEQGKIIHVPQVPVSSQHLLAEMIQAVQIDVGEELAGQVADRQATTPAIRGEQIVSGVIAVDRLLGIGPVDDPVRQGQGPGAGNAATQVAFQQIMVDGRKIPPDIAPQHVPVVVTERLVAGHGAVRPFACAVGVAIEDKPAFEDRLTDRA